MQQEHCELKWQHSRLLPANTYAEISASFDQTAHVLHIFLELVSINRICCSRGLIRMSNRRNPRSLHRSPECVSKKCWEKHILGLLYECSIWEVSAYPGETMIVDDPECRSEEPLRTHIVCSHQLLPEVVVEVVLLNT